MIDVSQLSQEQIAVLPKMVGRGCVDIMCDDCPFNVYNKFGKQEKCGFPAPDTITIRGIGLIAEDMLLQLKINDFLDGNK
jgi:hypothetical protein